MFSFRNEVPVAVGEMSNFTGIMLGVVRCVRHILILQRFGTSPTLHLKFTDIIVLANVLCVSLLINYPSGMTRQSKVANTHTHE